MVLLGVIEWRVATYYFPEPPPVAFFSPMFHRVWEVDVGECGGPEPSHAHTIPIGNTWLSGYGRLVDLGSCWKKMSPVPSHHPVAFLFPKVPMSMGGCHE